MTHPSPESLLQKAIAIAIEREREECAKVVENYCKKVLGHDESCDCYYYLARAIRTNPERGK